MSQWPALMGRAKCIADILDQHKAIFFTPARDSFHFKRAAEIVHGQNCAAPVSVCGLKMGKFCISMLSGYIMKDRPHAGPDYSCNSDGTQICRHQNPGSLRQCAAQYRDETAGSTPRPDRIGGKHRGFGAIVHNACHRQGAGIANWH